MRTIIKECICSICETGRRDYALDKRSPFCTYIDCYQESSCSKFVSMRKMDNANNVITASR